MVERRTGEDGSFLADGLTGSAPSLVFGTGRVCIEPECNVRLSRYNSTDWCALHESPASTQRPYDTSTRQRSSRRRNSRRRTSVSTSVNGSAGTRTAGDDRSPATSSSAPNGASGSETVVTGSNGARVDTTASTGGRGRRSTAA
jgi:hypothetical protein